MLTNKRIECIRCGDEFGSVPKGTKGTVIMGPNSMKQIIVEWDDSSSLILIDGVDQYKIIGDDMNE